MIQHGIDAFVRQKKDVKLWPDHKFGSTYRCEPSMWGKGLVVTKNAVNQSRKKEALGASDDAVPGPKYDTTQDTFKTKKSAPFSTANRFGKGVL